MTELQTGVDQLMELVRKKKKLSVADAAKKLGVPEATVQAWVDFLVEEHILGVEYKFTTPYIYVHSEERLDAVRKKEEYALKDFRDVFVAYAQQKGIPHEKIAQLWSEHLRYVADTQRQFFLDECGKRGLKNGEELYSEYVEALQHGA